MTGRAESLRLLVELTLREDDDAGSSRWRRHTAAEIAAGLRANGVDRQPDDLVRTLTALLDGTAEEIPDELVAPLAVFFGASTSDLTGEPEVVETGILERQLVGMGASRVLFCRDNLARPVANRLLRTVLDVLRRPATDDKRG